MIRLFHSKKGRKKRATNEQSCSGREEDSVEVYCTDRAMQCLTFDIGKKICGLDLSHVHKIASMSDIVCRDIEEGAISGRLDHTEGLIPVVDIRSVIDEKKDSPEMCVLVLETRGAAFGLIIDGVSEIIDIEPSSITPDVICDGYEAGFISGAAEVSGGGVFMLDVDALANLTCSAGTAV